MSASVEEFAIARIAYDSRMKFTLLPHLHAVVRLAHDAPMPSWLPADGFVSITRTDDELSIVCRESPVPEDVQAERSWRVLKLLGPIPFETTGVAAAFTAPLARAGISVFVVSTFDTDYLLVKKSALERSVDELRDAGFEVEVP
jgi:hypothetical protein